MNASHLTLEPRVSPAMACSPSESVVFAWLQAWNVSHLSSDDFARQQGLTPVEHQALSMAIVRTFMDDTSPQDIATSSHYEQAKAKAAARRSQQREKWQKLFIGNSPFRAFWVNRKPTSAKQESRDTQTEAYIDTVEKYFDEAFFTLANLRKNLILSRQSAATGAREGIILKEYPYQQFSVVNVFSVLDANYDVIEGSLEGEQIGTLIRFKGIPTRDELIDYLCVQEELEKQPPSGWITDDQGRKPYWEMKDFIFPAQVEQLALFS